MDPQSEEYTWKHRQPSRVVRIADRVPCETSVLARILKRHIGQEENLQLLICSVNASRLWRMRGRRGKRKRQREKIYRKAKASQRKHQMHPGGKDSLVYCCQHHHPHLKTPKQHLHHAVRQARWFSLTPQALFDVMNSYQEFSGLQQ